VKWVYIKILWYRDRPCAVVLTAEDSDGETVVTVVPITHSPPEDPEAAVEIPPATKERLGLDAARSWVVVGETNTFVWPGPDLRPIDRKRPGEVSYGVLPPALFRQVRDRLVAVYKARCLKSVRRSE
jgi:hypothetical protein